MTYYRWLFDLFWVSFGVGHLSDYTFELMADVAVSVKYDREAKEKARQAEEGETC